VLAAFAEPAGTIMGDGLDIMRGDIPGTDITEIFVLTEIGTNGHALSPAKNVNVSSYRE